jgi:hypothetical protein
MPDEYWIHFDAVFLYPKVAFKSENSIKMHGFESQDRARPLSKMNSSHEKCGKLSKMNSISHEKCSSQSLYFLCTIKETYLSFNTYMYNDTGNMA